MNVALEVTFRVNSPLCRFLSSTAGDPLLVPMTSAVLESANGVGSTMGRTRAKEAHSRYAEHRLGDPNSLRKIDNIVGFLQGQQSSGTHIPSESVGKSNKDKKSYKRESICILIVTFALGRTGYPEKNSHSKYTLSLKADLMHSKDDTSRAAM